MAKKTRRYRPKGKKKRRQVLRPVQERPPLSVPETAAKPRPVAEKHLEPQPQETVPLGSRDYSYVASDLKRTLIITGALFALLIILAIFW